MNAYRWSCTPSGRLLLLGGALLLAGCSGAKPAATATATAAAVAPTATATAARTATPTLTATPAALTALNGLRCVGQWRNTTFGSTGAFSARVEAGAGGGLITFEVGGNVFGGSGGVFTAPFRQVGNALVIDQRSDFLGQVQASIEPGGKTTGTLTAPPALGPSSKVTLTDYSYSAGALKFGLNIDFGGARPPATSVVEAACTKQ